MHIFPLVTPVDLGYHFTVIVAGYTKYRMSSRNQTGGSLECNLR